MAEVAVPKVIGKYRVVDELGTGGMGAVFLGVDETLDRRVAIKILRPDDRLSSDRLTQITNEARSLARINNPHVVQVYEFAPEADPPYLVMEHVAGGSLAGLLERRGQLEPRRVVDCACQVLSGLAVAHEAGVIHRDVKPSNILLAANGTYKLVDFGLAIPVAHDPGHRGPRIAGTIRYLAPEVARGEPATVGADLYALGMTVWQLLAGEHPFTEADTLRLLNRVGQEAVPPIAERRPDLPTPFCAWVDRLLARTPAERFGTAREALAVLQECADELPDAAPSLPVGAVCRDASTVTVPAALVPRPSAPPETRATLPAVPVETLRPPRREPPAEPAPAAPRPRLRFFFRLLVSIWAVCAVAVFLTGWLTMHSGLAVQQAKWRDELMASARAAALLVQPGPHRELAGPEDMAGHPYFAELRAALRAFATTNPHIEYIYTMRRLADGTVVFVCDASEERDRNGNGRIDAEEANAKTGEVYPEAAELPRLLEGFLHPAADDAINEDQWGSHLSAYAPVLAADGTPTGDLVGIDASGDLIGRAERDFLVQILLMEGAVLCAVLAAGGLIAHRLHRPLRQLQEVMGRVRTGDLSVRAPEGRGDEFGALADGLNEMIGGLRERDAIRAAYEGHLVKEVAQRLFPHGPPPDAEAHRSYLACNVSRFRADRADTDLSSTVTLEVLPALFELILRSGGTVERIGNDGFVAIFGGDEGCRERALRTALDLQRLVATCRERSGRPVPVLGVGISDGSAPHAETAAQRLAAATAVLGDDILVDRETFTPLRHMFCADRYPAVTLVPGEAPVDVIALKAAVAG